MRISAKGEYAIKAMLDLAMHRGRTLVPIQEIAEDSNATVFTYNRTMREDCARFGGRIATEVADDRLLDADRKAELAARAKSWLASDCDRKPGSGHRRAL